MALAGAMALSFYAGHSGVASIQIALLSMLGYRAGERYLFPLAATSPRDFWRRWNVYLGQWLRCYVYIPCARSLGRRAPAPVPVAGALAVLAAFVACGVLHAGVQRLIHGRTPWTVVVAFAVHGCALIAWDGAARVFRARAGRGSAVSRAASRLLFIQFSLVMLLWLYPALAGA
jgi:D-alanyl-lipoteichoic acid acyltransferase DltB (MBOAT superfamily)